MRDVMVKTFLCKVTCWQFKAIEEKDEDIVFYYSIARLNWYVCMSILFRY